MKKLLVTILALVMALGVTTMAWADDGNGSKENPYSLDQFNALQTIPEGTTDVYVSIGDISLTGAGKCATVGNYNISDQYAWVNDGATAPVGYTATNRKNAQNNATAYRTNKAGYTVHVLGTLNAENYSNKNFSGFQTLCFQLPEKCTVVLEDMTLHGSFNISGNYTYMYNLPDGSIGHLQNPKREGYTNVWYGFPFMIESIKLSGCTVNGQWLGNGDIAKSVEISNCTFNDYNNTGNANWANPIWWKNASNTDLTITDCKVTSTRPMKVGEGGVGNVTVADNTFTMLPGDKYTSNDDDKVKNTALSFGPKVYGDVDISNNAVEGSATALVSLLKTDMTMPEGKTFQVINNKLPDGAKTTVEWKKATEAAIGFIEVTPYTPAPTPSTGGYYYYPSTPGITAELNGTNKSATDYPGGDYGLVFRSTAAFSTFQGVQVDGKTLAKSNYTAEEGSTVVYLKAAYLKTLAAGKYTITILSTAGNTSMDFTIGGKSSSPKTFDAGMGIYAVTAVLSVTGMAWTAKKRH